MRKTTFTPQVLLLFVCLAAFLPFNRGWAQITCGANTQLGGQSGCARSGTLSSYGIVSPTGGTTPITLSVYSPGTFIQVPVLSGGCYTISTCGAPFDTQINCFQGNNTTAPFAYDDDSGPLCATTAASCTMVPNFSDYAAVDVKQYACLPGGTSSITVTVQQNNNLTITNSSASMCQGQSRTLSATPVPVGTAQPGSGSLGTFSGTGVSGATFTAPAPASNSQAYTITYTFGFVSTTQSITVFHQPTTSNAGPDQAVCATSATLAGNAPAFGSGQWTTSTPGVTINSPTSATSTVTGLPVGGTAVFRWTISNGVCNASVDSIVVTRNTPPTASAAGTDQVVCTATSSISGNTPAVGSGLWSSPTPGVTIAAPTSPTTGVSGLPSGSSALFRWTITSGVCPASIDTVIITRNALPTTSNAGPDQTVCSPSTTLSGNAPSIGTGQWTTSTPGVTITSPASSVTAVNGLPSGGTAIFRWSITNGVCPVSRDSIVVMRDAVPTPANAGGDVTVCNDSILLGGNTPAIGTGTWTTVQGPSSAVSPNNPASMVVGLQVGTNSLMWTVANGVCPSSSDTVTVTRDAQAPQPIAGPDKEICDSQTNLTGNIPSIGTGTWDVISGSGVVTAPNSPNSTITGINIGTTIVTWSILNGTCPIKHDTVIITRHPLPSSPTVSGPSAVCYGQPATLTASTSAPNPTILWWDAATNGSVLATGSTFMTPPLSGPITVFAEVTDGNTTCTSSRTQHTININALPSVNIGADTAFCNTDSLCLDAGAGMSAYNWSNGSTGRIFCTNQSGFYWVEVTDGNGCHNTDTIALTALAAPAVALGPDVTICAGNSHTFSVPSSPTQTYLWSNGATTNSINVSAAATYTVTVTSDNGCANSDAALLTVREAPIANFSIDQSGCPAIVFNDLSSDSDTWLWTFGDGGTSGGQNPSHTYTSNGNYTVTLTSTNQCGSDAVTQTLPINCLVGVSMPDNLSITVYPNPNDGEFKIAFDGLEDKLSLKIFNLAGQEVYAKDIDGCNGACEEVVNMRGVAAGTYVAIMKVGDVSLSKRIIVR